MSKHNATTTDVCLPLHTHRTIWKHQMCLGVRPQMEAPKRFSYLTFLVLG